LGGTTSELTGPKPSGQYFYAAIAPGRIDKLTKPKPRFGSELSDLLGAPADEAENKTSTF
jgi:hypothetical protein